MTMYEMNFSLLVEDMLQNIDQPEYRQIIVEVSKSFILGKNELNILHCIWGERAYSRTIALKSFQTICLFMVFIT